MRVGVTVASSTAEIRVHHGASAASFTALAGTLLFFDLKARGGGALPPEQRYPELPPRDWDAPERPY